MKRLLLVTAYTILMLCACKKNSSVPANTITVDINGVKQNFVTGVKAVNDESPASSIYSIAILGNVSSDPNSALILISINDSASIKPGVYPFGNLYINYENPPAIATSYIFDPGIANPGSVTITSRTATNIQGTFSCYLSARGGDKKILSNGRFNANFNP